MVILFGACAVGAIFVSQLVLLGMSRDQGEDEILDHVRLVNGRQAVLSLFDHEGAVYLRAVLPLPAERGEGRGEGPRLELARRDKKPVLAKWPGVLAEHELKDEELARRFLCRAGSSFDALARVKGALLASDLDLRELRLDRGELALVLRAGRGELDRVTGLLEALDRALLAGQAVLVKAAGAEHARCGFCHAELALEVLATTACDRCSTPVHELCWEEHGHCPVLGCGGARVGARDQGSP
jgi:hypothetical protein